jgi:hypothetical protein
VSNGRQEEAVVVLRAIATFNSNSIDIDHEDVIDNSLPGTNIPSPSPNSPKLEEEGSLSPTRYAANRSALGAGHDRAQSYDATGQHKGPPLTRQSTLRVGSAFYTPLDERTDVLDGISVEPRHDERVTDHRRPIVRQPEEASGGIFERLGMLFVPQWRRTTILMWIIWGSMSLAYTMCVISIQKSS